MKHWSVLKKSIALAVIAAVLFGGAVVVQEYKRFQLWQRYFGPSEHTKVDRDRPLREQTARVELGDRAFDIPIMFIDSAHWENGVVKDSILLEVIWPEMRSSYELSGQAEYDRVVKQERRKGWILLEPAHIRPSLDEQAANRRLYLTKEDVAPSEYGLEKFLWYHGRPEAPTLWAELYFENDRDGRIVTTIECVRSASVRFPICEHRFIEGGLIYKVSYNQAAFLPEWHTQQQRAIEFLRGFEIADAQQEHNAEVSDTRPGETL